MADEPIEHARPTPVKPLPSLETPAEILPAKPGNPNPPAHLKRLADRARDYAKASSSANTQRAYASDWRHFESWSRRAGVETAPDPQTIGLYLAACAATSSVRTIERRLSAIAWQFAQRGTPLDRADRHIATVLAGIRRQHGRPPACKEDHGKDSRGILTHRHRAAELALCDGIVPGGPYTKPL
jgi:hypothetical protein